MATLPQQKTISKRQVLNTQAVLENADPAIKRDAEILENLRKIVNDKKIGRLAYLPLKKKPALYKQYRGSGFPLKTKANKRLPQWRSLTPWMKVQLCTFVLGEGPLLYFTIKLHQQVLDEKLATGKDLKDYLRDRVNRCMRERLDFVPSFFMVLEEWDKWGEKENSPHAHGCIALPKLDLPISKNGQIATRCKNMAAKKGGEHAELAYARSRIKEAMNAAAGMLNRPKVWNGVQQSKKSWVKKPAKTGYHDAWVTYAFKNFEKYSPTLGNRRLAISRPLLTEAQKFWQLLKKGEDAMDQW